MKPLHETTLVKIIFFFMNMSNALGAIAKMPRQVSHRIKDAIAITVITGIMKTINSELANTRLFG